MNAKWKRLVTAILMMALLLGPIVSMQTPARAADGEDDNTFIVGFDAEFPPYGYKDDNGEYVGFDLDLAQEVCDRNGCMRTLERSSAKLQGLDYRLKSTDSLARKITSDADEDQVSLAAAAAGISDVLRYTLTCSDADYSTMVPQAMAALTEKGYRVEKFRNAWGGKFYQGVNVHLMSPAGVRVELQFHTPQSFAVKQASHAVYEIRRNPASSAEEVEEATRLSIAYNAAVVVPEGARAIHWPVAA